eukprot:4200454-Amphidinium_carterae.2
MKQASFTLSWTQLRTTKGGGAASLMVDSAAHTCAALNQVNASWPCCLANNAHVMGQQLLGDVNDQSADKGYTRLGVGKTSL